MCKEIIVEHFASEERVRTQYKNMYSTCTNDLKPLEMQVSTYWFKS